MPPRSEPAAPQPGRREKNLSREPADHALGRSRGGFGTKLHLLCDGQGTPLVAQLMPGQRHESTGIETMLEQVRLPRPGAQGGRPRTRPQRLVADKGYSVKRIRCYLRQRGIHSVIPTRKDQRPSPRFDKSTYRRRNVIERAIGWLKEYRRLGTRFEKLAIHFLGMVTLAMIQRCLRQLDPSNRA